jgi:cytoplasmic iron level regulating protein YaaA (DUF328/UPF0246 family)
MRIIISPAKKMNIDNDSLIANQEPIFLNKSKQVLSKLKEMDYHALKSLWACNDKIASLNFERIKQMRLDNVYTPAILAYEGLQYQYMAPHIFEQRHFDYIEEHLRILSGFYGLLRPFDGVMPYRLEMQANLSIGKHKDLYAFWGDSLAKQLSSETNTIVNLASKEYSKIITAHLPVHTKIITCKFGELKGDKVVEKATACKMARGEMVRFMAENEVTSADALKTFNLQDYHYEASYSSEDCYVFLKKTPKISHM